MAALGLLGLGGGCEEGPDQILKPLPDDFDPDKYNGGDQKGHVNTGEQKFEWTSSGEQVGTAKICEADELAKRWSAMVKKDIVPTRGAGGLDLRGKPEWAGLTLDEAQKELCQAYVYSSDMVYWGDNAELIAFYDSKNRLIDRLVTLTGYEGTIEAGGYEIAVNKSISKDGKAMADATGDATLLAMNTAFLKKFRPEVKNPEQRDCVAENTCYVMDWYTLKRFVFNDVMLDFALTPENRIDHIGVNLHRTFEFEKSPLDFKGATAPAAGLPPVPVIDNGKGCKPTLGVGWDHITKNCLGIDPEAKALIRPVWSNEALLADMGGLGLYLQRTSLKKDEVFADTTNKAAGTDKIIGFYVNSTYEGDIKIPRDTWYAAYLARVAAQVKAMVPAVDMTAKFAKIKPKGDGKVLLLGTQKIEDCNASPCTETTLTKHVRKLVEDAITACNCTVPDKMKNDPNFFVEPLLREFAKMFNDGKEPTASDVYLALNNESAQVLYITLLRKYGGDRYAVKTGYDNKADQLYYLFFKKGAMRTEDVLFKDAEDVQPDKNYGDGVFRLWNLVNSKRLGLATKLTVLETKTKIQKALVKVAISPPVEVLVNWHKQDSVSGFSIPLEGDRDMFVPAAYYGFSGNVVGASFWADKKGGVVKAISSSSFYDKLDFCGVKVGLYEEIEKLIPQLPSTCERILSYTENGKFLTAMSTYVQQTPFKIGLRLWVTAGRVDGAYYWAEE
jgi:hypothetical protein